MTRGNEHHHLPSYMKKIFSMRYRFFNVVHSLSGQRLKVFGACEDQEPPAKVGRHVCLNLKVCQMNQEPRLPQSHSEKYL